MLKQNKGITLVALVITIIVLLILAGVSIALVVGDNGVLTQSKNSSDATKMGQMKEALGLAITSCQTNYLSNYASNASTNFDAIVNAKTISDALANYDSSYYLVKGASGSGTAVSTNDTFGQSGVSYMVTDGKNFLKVDIARSGNGTGIGLTATGWGTSWVQQ